MLFFEKLYNYPKTEHKSLFYPEFCAKVRIFFHFCNEKIMVSVGKIVN